MGHDIVLHPHQHRLIFHQGNVQHGLTERNPLALGDHSVLESGPHFVVGRGRGRGELDHLTFPSGLG